MNTLEEYGINSASDMGYDVEDPIVRDYIVQTARNLRDTTPGVADVDIIQQQGDVLKQQFMPPKNNAPAIPTAVAPAPVQAPMAAPPVAPVAPAVQAYQPIAPAYNAAREKINQQFSPEAEQAARNQNKYGKLGAELGRELGASARIGAGAANAKLLDENFAESQRNLDKPFVEWQAKKAQAVAGLEDMLKAGRISNEDVTAQVQALGLEQALAERTSKNAQMLAESDANSVTSESYRVLAKQYAPDLVAKLGNRFETMTAAQIKANLPTLEKRYEQILKTQKEEADRKEKIAEREFKAGESKADRESRERTSAASASATIRAAEIRAQAERDKLAAKGKGEPTVKVGDVLKGQKLEGDLDKRKQAAEAQADGARETIKLFDRTQELIDDGLSTGPVVGGDNYISKAYNFFSSNKQQADSIGAELVTAMAKTFGAAPSDAESALIREANTVLKLDNPGPKLTELKSKFERALQQRQQEAADIQVQKNRVRSTIGLPADEVPKVDLPTTNSRGWKLHVDANGNRAYVSPDGKQVEEL